MFSYRDLVIHNHIDRTLSLCGNVWSNDDHSRPLASAPKPILTIIRSEDPKRHVPMPQDQLLFNRYKPLLPAGS